MAGMRSQRKKRTTQSQAIRGTGGIRCDHGAVAISPRILQYGGAVARHAKGKHVVKGKAEEIGAEEIPAGQSFEAIAPIANRLAPPQHERGLHAGMIAAV